jgi:hypothetical protein
MKDLQMLTIPRRNLLVGAIGAPACAMAIPAFGDLRPQEDLHLLSTQGCGRATGYAEANRIITLNGKTHVAWLDSPTEGFRVRIATLDRKSGQWSPTYTVGEAKDNHGGPALTIDSEGHLHITYFTHHDPFRYRRSKRQNDASEWEDEVQFGERLTYPTMICGPDDTLYFSARRSFGDRPWIVELWEKKPGRDWNLVGPILSSRHNGYAHFQESLAWGPDHRTVHLCCRFHEKSDKNSYGRLQTVAYMKSHDLGRTWRRSDGSRIKGPITPDNIEVLEKGGEDFKRGLRAGCLAVSPTGQPHLIYSVDAKLRGESWLARPDGTGRWKRTRLNDHLPAEWKAFNLIMAGGLAIDRAGRLHGAAQLQTGERKEKIWGDPTNEIVAFTVDGDDRIQFRAVSEFDAGTSHWLPSIERPTGHNEVAPRPGILFTAGPAGKKNTDLLNNRVYFRHG